MLAMNGMLGPKPANTETKLEPFECGATPIDTRNVKAVPVKYYAVAIVFILFDLETVFLFLWVLGAQPLTGFMLFTFAHLHLPAGADAAVRVQGAAARSGAAVTMDARTIPRPAASATGKSAAFEFLSTRKDELVGWARKFSLFPTRSSPPAARWSSWR